MTIIIALSYNSLGILTMVVTGILLATGEQEKRMPYIFAGSFFAYAVLCCPYLIIVYFFGMAAWAYDRKASGVLLNKSG